MPAKPEYLLVDGYNIIFAWEELKALAEDSLEDARVRLLGILSDYQGSTGLQVILVFDAHKVKRNPGAVEDHGNVTVVYTKEAQTADHYIERTARSLTRGGIKVHVATSDNLEQLIIVSHGALRISAAQLLENIKATAAQNRAKYIENKPVKNNLLLDNLDKETAQLLEKLRRT